MRFSLIILALVLSLSAMAERKPTFEKNRFFVKMNQGASFVPTKNTTKIKELFNNTYVVHTNNIKKDMEIYRQNKNVALVEKSYLAGKRELAKPVKTQTVTEIPFLSDPSSHPFDDPKTDRLWGFNKASSGGMGVNKAYDNPLPLTKKEVIVAVVDTGVDYNHEELKNVMWINPNEIAGNGIDDDQNGYVDDIHGIDTLKRNSDGIPSGDPKHSHAHGTHVAGTIAAEQNNGIGITGVASKVKIMALRTVPDRGDETDIDIVESFIYAAKHGAKLINCSFGKKHNEGGMIVSEAIDFIGEEYGTLVIASAGNDRSNIEERKKYPASFENDNLLVIASNQKGGSLSSFSNYGEISVDLAAPGSRILSTVPGNMYATYDGTSMASPNTTGVAAEVLSHYPELGPVELKNRLMDTVSKERENKTVSGGIVNLYNALNL